MKYDNSDYLLDFEFGEDDPKPTPKYFYFNTAGLYSELAKDFHYATVECCPDCIQWLRTPADLAITCTEDFDLVPLRPLVYATVNENETLDVIRELGANMAVGTSPRGYRLSVGSDQWLIDTYAARVKEAQEERLRLMKVGQEVEQG